MKPYLNYIKTFWDDCLENIWIGRIFSTLWTGLFALFIFGFLALLLVGLVSQIQKSQSETMLLPTQVSESIVQFQSKPIDTILELTANHEVRFYAEGRLVGVLKFTESGVSFGGDADASARRFIQMLSQAWRDELRTFSRNAGSEGE